MSEAALSLAKSASSLGARGLRPSPRASVLLFGKGTVGAEVLAQLASLPGRPLHPAARLQGSEAQVAIWSKRYPGPPLRVQGPGAGAAVTAGGVIADVLRAAGRC